MWWLPHGERRTTGGLLTRVEGKARCRGYATAGRGGSDGEDDEIGQRRRRVRRGDGVHPGEEVARGRGGDDAVWRDEVAATLRCRER